MSKKKKPEKPKLRTWHLRGDILRAGMVAVRASTYQEAIEAAERGDFTEIIDESGSDKEAGFGFDNCCDRDHVRIVGDADGSAIRVGTDHEETVVGDVPYCKLCGPVVDNDPEQRGESPNPDYHPELYAEDA